MANAKQATAAAKLLMTLIPEDELALLKAAGSVSDTNRVVYTAPFRLEVKEGDFRVGLVEIATGPVNTKVELRVSLAGEVIAHKGLYAGLTKAGEKRKPINPSFRTPEFAKAFISLVRALPDILRAEGALPPAEV